MAAFRLFCEGFNSSGRFLWGNYCISCFTARIEFVFYLEKLTYFEAISSIPLI